MNESNELNQNKINEIDKKQKGLKLKLTFKIMYNYIIIIIIDQINELKTSLENLNKINQGIINNK